MPYVQRDFLGKIVGVYACPQPQPDGTCLTDPDPLPEDHPDVVEYMKVFQPAIDQALNLTEEDWRKHNEEEERIQKEIEQLQNLVLRHAQSWAQLETAMSALLHVAIDRPSSSIAYAIYHCLNGFDARQNIVNHTMIQVMDENPDLEPIRAPWTQTNKKIQAAREKRNQIVHGVVQTLIYGKKPTKRAVLSPLPFDVIRIRRRIQNGEHPGMTVNELTTAIHKIDKLSWCVDGFQIVISEFLRFGPATLPKTIPQLEVRQKDLNSP